MNILLDSSAVIDLFKNNQKVLKMIEEADEIYTSVICAYEVLLGEEYLKIKNKTSLIERAHEFFETTATLPLSYSVSTNASYIAASLSTKGKKLDDFDILIASQALMVNATVLTKDAKHFGIIKEETGLQIHLI